MSRENVEIVRGIWEADRQRNAGAVRVAYAPDVEWEDTTGLWGDWGTARGPDGIQAAWRRWYEAFEDVRFEWDEVTDAGDDVVVTYRARARGRGSEPSSIRRSRSSGPSGRGRLYGFALTRTELMRSEPPDCGSRRCRRRTWRWLTEPLAPSPTRRECLRGAP